GPLPVEWPRPTSPSSAPVEVADVLPQALALRTLLAEGNLAELDGRLASEVEAAAVGSDRRLNLLLQALGAAIRDLEPAQNRWVRDSTLPYLALTVRGLHFLDRAYLARGARNLPSTGSQRRDAVQNLLRRAQHDLHAATDHQ